MLFSINISMVTNICSGTASGQALFNDELHFSKPASHNDHQVDPDWVELALGEAASKGFSLRC